MKKWLFLWVFFCSGVVMAQDLQPLPDLWQRVTDKTGTLSETQIQQLENKLAAFENKKGSQIAVLIIPTTEPEPIEDYSIRLAEKWKIGRQGVDDGVILLIAKNDRRVRIEVGYGLEGAIPDATAIQIINNYVTPNFKQGNFYEGIDAGTDALMSAIDGEPLPKPEERQVSQEKGFPYFILVIVFVVLGRLLGAKIGKWKGISLGAVVALVAGLIIAGLGAALIMLFMYGFISVATLFSGRGFGRGGYYGGGFGRGGGFGGGGFSGGGGGFGGGGASGSW